MQLLKETVSSSAIPIVLHRKRQDIVQKDIQDPPIPTIRIRRSQEAPEKQRKSG
jgi:hypothetical protein